MDRKPVASRPRLRKSGEPVTALLLEAQVQLSVVSKVGKEATIGILNNGDFFGEGSLAGRYRFHNFAN